MIPTRRIPSPDFNSKIHGRLHTDKSLYFCSPVEMYCAVFLVGSSFFGTTGESSFGRGIASLDQTENLWAFF